MVVDLEGDVGEQDTPLKLVHPVDGHLVDTPKAGNFYVCNGAPGEKWQPCRARTVDDKLVCEVPGHDGPLDCASMKIVDPNDTAKSAIPAAFSDRN